MLYSLQLPSNSPPAGSAINLSGSHALATSMDHLPDHPFVIAIDDGGLNQKPEKVEDSMKEEEPGHTVSKTMVVIIPTRVQYCLTSPHMVSVMLWNVL